MLHRCVLHFAHHSYRHVRVYACLCGWSYILYISAWGLCVVRFDLIGNAKTSMCEASKMLSFTLFLCLYVVKLEKGKPWASKNIYSTMNKKIFHFGGYLLGGTYKDGGKKLQ